MSDPDLKDQSGWQSCQPGIFQQSCHLKSQSERRLFLSTAASWLVGGVAVCLGIRKITDLSDEKPDDMKYSVTCFRVQENMDEYIQNSIDNEKLILKIEAHLMDYQCASCLKVYEERKNALTVSGPNGGIETRVA